MERAGSVDDGELSESIRPQSQGFRYLLHMQWVEHVEQDVKSPC